MKRLLIVLAAASLSACPGPSPTPIPTPTPPPLPGIVYPELLLRQQSGVLSRGGRPHQLFGAIPCWDPEEKNHYGWAGFDQAWLDYVFPFGANIMHMRLGPAPVDPPGSPANGLNYQHSPYVNGDPAQGFDQVWWDRAEAMVDHAGKMEINVEIDLIDGWILKHAAWGDYTSPWSGELLVADSLKPIHKEFLRKAVATFGRYGNVIWQDGNEIAQATNYSPQWSLGMVDYVRQLEQEVGLGVVHMFGTNSGRAAVENDSRIDYTSTHSKSPITGPVAGKFRENNEHNPPSSPEVERDYYCQAKKAGQAWWYWRGGQTADEMDKTLRLMSQECGEVACVIPGADDPGWIEPPTPAAQRPSKLWPAVEAAMNALPDPCGQATADHSAQVATLERLAAKLREQGICAAQAVDSVSIKAADGYYEEWHAVYFGDGCFIRGSWAYKNAWQYAGDNQ